MSRKLMDYLNVKSFEDLSEGEELSQDDIEELEQASEEAESELEGVNESTEVIEEGQDAIDDAEEVSEALESLITTMSKAIDNDEVTPSTVKLFNTSMEALTATVGIDYRRDVLAKQMPALESIESRYGNSSVAARYQGEIALEEAKSTLKKITDAIIDFFKRMLEWTKKLWGKIISTNARVVKRAKVLKSKLEKNEDNFNKGLDLVIPERSATQLAKYLKENGKEEQIKKLKYYITLYKKHEFSENDFTYESYIKTINELINGSKEIINSKGIEAPIKEVEKDTIVKVTTSEVMKITEEVVNTYIFYLEKTRELISLASDTKDTLSGKLGVSKQLVHFTGTTKTVVFETIPGLEDKIVKGIQLFYDTGINSVFKNDNSFNDTLSRFKGKDGGIKWSEYMSLMTKIVNTIMPDLKSESVTLNFDDIWELKGNLPSYEQAKKSLDIIEKQFKPVISNVESSIKETTNFINKTFNSIKSDDTPREVFNFLNALVKTKLKLFLNIFNIYLPAFIENRNSLCDLIEVILTTGGSSKKETAEEKSEEEK